MIRFLYCALIVSASAWATDYVTPTVRVADMPYFSDDIEFKNLVLALDRQIESYQTTNPVVSGTIKLGDTVYPRQRLLDSAIAFRDIAATAERCVKAEYERSVPLAELPMGLGPCVDAFNDALKRDFVLYMPDVTPDDPRHYDAYQALFTSYYSPELKGSLTKTDRFKYAIYSMPKTEALRTMTRTQIDFDNKLAGKGLELFYVENMFDLYQLHIEGGGVVTIEKEDGTTDRYYISYAGHNSQKFNFISQYMVRKGYIKDSSVDAQRNYFESHTSNALWREIYSTCPSYIYFKKTDNPPIGMNDIPLTDFRSMATDTRYYAQKGLIGYVVAKKPVRRPDGTIEFIDFSRFFIDQDTGGAIRGKARADLYWGIGRDGELAAANMKQQGDMFFLIRKDALPEVAPTPAPTPAPVEPTPTPEA